MGALVRLGDGENKEDAIALYMPDDGRQTVLLRVGLLHCFIKLSLKATGDLKSPYIRTAEVKTVGDWVTKITPCGPANESSSRIFFLAPGSQVAFGTGEELRYRYVAPEDTQLACWASREFTWSPEMKAQFGGPRSNSAVYLVRKRHGIGSRHALKIISMSKFTAYPQLERMADRELQILRSLRHENVLELQVYRRDELHKQIIFVFPEMIGGNLFDFVRRNRCPVKQVRLSNKLAPSTAKQLLSAFKYLRECDIAHRDVKPENILLADEWSDDAEDPPKIVLGDFGISRYAGEIRTEPYDGGTLDWVSPRSFRNHEVPDYPMDLWGLGLVVWFIIAGLPKPWGECCFQDEDDEKDKLDWSRLIDLNITRDCTDFLRGFLVRSPELCRSIEKSEEHSWIEHEQTVEWSVKEGFAFDADGLALTSSRTELRFDDTYG
ncbi:hypothetical protein FRC04_003096 [Tulasnella sp. 424]|nr:hypothetical protein FRC04_003096 [Tulasnella sp. 424]